MAQKQRTPHETKEIGLKQLKDAYEQNNRTIIPPEKMKELVRLYEKEILPKVFEDRK